MALGRLRTGDGLRDRHRSSGLYTLQFGIANVLNLAYGSTMTVGAFIAYPSCRELGYGA